MKGTRSLWRAVGLALAVQLCLVARGARQAWSVAPSNSTTDIFDVGRIILGASLSILPTLIGFLLLQRYWRSGLTMGAIKA